MYKALPFSLFILVTLLFALPFPSHAQDTGPATYYCPRITQDLRRGDCDQGIISLSCLRHVPNSQVTELQTFLSSYFEDYPDDAVTGKFLNTTRRFVKQFQRDQSITSTGYVGPLTRAAIQRVCGQTTLPPANPLPPQNLSCQTPWGTTIQSGSSVIAYQLSSVPQGQQCVFETRYCQNGTLTGSYQYQTCSVANASCTPENPQTQTLTCPTGQTGAITQTRTSTCPGPTWGAWTTTSNTCTDSVPQCTPLPAQTQTLSCPTGQTGLITQTRTSSCPGPTWSNWTTTSNTCTVPPPPPNPNVGACTYKGQTYAEGATISIITGSGTSADPLIATLKCDNGVWAVAGLHMERYIFSYETIIHGQDVCDGGIGGIIKNNDEMNNLGCPYPRPAKAFLSVRPRHGAVPLTVSLFTPVAQSPPHKYTIYWGDGASEEQGPSGDGIHTHAYAASGTYTINYTVPGGLSNSANIRVDAAGTASLGSPQLYAQAAIQNQSPNQSQMQSQLASALSALESSLKAILFK